MEKVVILSNDRAWREALAADLEASGHQATALALDGLGDLSPDPDAPVTAVVVDHRLPGTVVPRPGRVRQLVGGGKAYVLAAFAPMQLAWVDFSPGFDDFLVEPFSGMQVAARTRQLRWRENHTEAAELLKVGDLLINTASCEVTLQGVALSLTYQEYELLRYLASHRGRVFTREQLLSELWGYNYYGGTRTVDVHIRRLRAKLGPEHEELIQTVRNVGYRFARDP
ncbi:MAG: response regulator transcription factor [Armatimonadetes bacterium]|jgi:DNA-binding response OmpR family regulator|nr:response regulator transcription factor [Armatimonadota bacterium]